MELKHIQGRRGFRRPALVKHLAELVEDEAPSQSVGNAGPHLHMDEHIDKRHLSPSLQAFRGRVSCSSGLH
jgi:hypothetical protein